MDGSFATGLMCHLHDIARAVQIGAANVLGGVERQGGGGVNDDLTPSVALRTSSILRMSPRISRMRVRQSA